MAEFTSLLVFLTLALSAVSVEAIKVKNCYQGSKPLLKLNSYDIKPNVIPVPGNLDLSFKIDLNKDLNAAQLDLVVKVQRKVIGFYVPVPCIAEVGSCTYDLCGLLSDTIGKKCPKELIINDIPCVCEDLEAGTYNMTHQILPLPKMDGAWAWLAHGHYKVDLKIHDRVTDRDVSCLHLEAEVKDPTPKEDECSGLSCMFGGWGR